MWIWVRAMRPEVWLVAMAGLVASGAAMWAVEAAHNEENFGTLALSAGGQPPADRPLAAATSLGHGVYYALAGWATRTEEFAPVSLPGRVLGLLQARRGGRAAGRGLSPAGRCARGARPPPITALCPRARRRSPSTSSSPFTPPT